MQHYYATLTKGSAMYKKIDLYVDGVYRCSTNQSKTCKAAIVRLKQLYAIYEDSKVTARYAK